MPTNKINFHSRALQIEKTVNLRLTKRHATSFSWNYSIASPFFWWIIQKNLSYKSFNSSFQLRLSNIESLETVKDHPFSMYAEFSEKLTFFTPLHAHVCARIRGYEILVFLVQNGTSLILLRFRDNDIFREKVSNKNDSNKHELVVWTINFNESVI